MTYEDFKKERDKLTKDANPDLLFDIHYSGDFQCDQTGGIPTELCWYMEENIAWLELKYDLVDDGIDVSEWEQGIADFGIRTCCDEDDFNALLEELGDDAVWVGRIPHDEDYLDLTEDEGLSR